MIRTAQNKSTLYGDDALEPSTYGMDVIGAGAISRQAARFLTPTGNPLIDGVLEGAAWKGSSLTYSFPDNKNDYKYDTPDHEKAHGFHSVNNNIKNAAKFILDQSFGGKANDGFSVEGFTDLKISQGSDSGSTLKYAGSSVPPTAWARTPSSHPSSGDIWFGKTGGYESAKTGNYAWDTVIHETGHALGLKHGHQYSFDGRFGPLPFESDSLETSIMTYRNFVGDDFSFYKVEKWGGPQTFMMADIAALQHMYGADFTTNKGSTTYMWKPSSGNTYVNGDVALHPGGNRIFATIWDGGGAHDKYNLSAYDNNVDVDLRPGSHSTFKPSQLSDLGAHSSDGPGAHMASGNIYNALLYKGDTRSLIEDAVTGSGNDDLTGNQKKNMLDGNGGDDKLRGMQGYDTLLGGGGSDTFFFQKGWDRDTIKDFSGQDKINLSSFNFTDFAQVLAKADNHGKDVILTFGHGDSLTIAHTHVGDLHANDFIL